MVTGPDRLSWLQGIVSSDVERLTPGEGSWGLVLTKQGKVLADVAIVAAEDVVYLGLPGAAVPRIEEWLNRFLVMEDAAVADASDDRAWAMLHGPNAPVVARAVLEAAGSPGTSASIDLSGLGGAALVVPRTTTSELEALVSRRGDVHVASESEWQRLRVERLVPLYGIDMDDQRSPHEASLERRTISWTKGCYLGQEAVCMQDMRGKVKRRLAIVLVSGTAPPSAGTDVTLPDGSRVGETRTAATSEVLGGPAAIALLTADASVPGTRVLVGGRDATVVEPR